MEQILYGAPMAGITDKPFRQICRKFTTQPLYTEMVGVNSFVRGSSATKRMMNLLEEQNIIVQLVGIDEKALIETALAAEQGGAVGVDINMGCPVKKLITNGSGAALMKTPDKAAFLVEEVVKAVNIPVSVKTRLGWECKNDVLTFAKKMRDAGVQRLAVHARTKVQGFSGMADWASCQVLARELLDIELIINGDVVDQSSYALAKERSGINNVMVGRALWGKPWLFQLLENKELQPYCLDELVTEHFELMLSFYGRAGFYAARKHLARYAKGLPNHAEFCTQMFHEETEKGVLTLIKSFFGNRTIKEKQ